MKTRVRLMFYVVLASTITLVSGCTPTEPAQTIELEFMDHLDRVRRLRNRSAADQGTACVERRGALLPRLGRGCGVYC